tara:strand:+ start:102 stop:302 length:201 start_codon:yes stop_codon:yes gene_type:complete
MPRAKRTYNLLLDEEVYDVLGCISNRRSRELGTYVSKAAIIRTAISFYLRAKREGKTVKPTIRKGV